MKYWLLGLFCVVLSGAALAAGPRAVRERVQASMLVTGSITVTPGGEVKSFAVDHPDQLPALVVGLIGRSAPKWRFVPVVRDGQPVFAKAHMSLRMVAKPVGDGKYSLSIAGSHFGQPSSAGNADDAIAAKHMRPPAYPVGAVRARISGTVYLALKVNRAGLVDEDAAEQVNLDVVGSDAEMRRWRKVLGDAALRAARRWTFTPPTLGPDAAKSSWLVRIPISFTLTENGRRKPATEYGHWRAYVPGPRNVPAWMHPTGLDGSADAIAADKVVEVGRGLRLTTPLNGA
jgi:hypothetical protein